MEKGTEKGAAKGLQKGRLVVAHEPFRILEKFLNRLVPPFPQLNSEDLTRFPRTPQLNNQKTRSRSGKIVIR
jgi:hypothetical protein